MIWKSLTKLEQFWIIEYDEYFIHTLRQSLKWNPCATHSQATRASPLKECFFPLKHVFEDSFLFSRVLLYVRASPGWPFHRGYQVVLESLLPDF